MTMAARILIAALLATTPAVAQEGGLSCLPYTAALEGMRVLERHRVVQAYSTDGASIMEVWADDAGDYAILFVSPTGVACVVDRGEALVIEAPRPGRDT